MILLLFFLFIIMLLVLYTAGITKDGTLEEKAEARRKAKAVLYRLWLGACLCNGFLLDMEPRVRFVAAHEQELSTLGR